MTPPMGVWTATGNPTAEMVALTKPILERATTEGRTEAHVWGVTWRWQPFDPDPLYVEPEPLDPRVPEPPMSPRSKGCIWAAGIGASLIVWVLVLAAIA